MSYSPLEGQRPELKIPIDGTEERVSIIIVHNNRPEFLNLMLQSITIMSQANNYEIVVVDNSTPDDELYEDSMTFLDELEEDNVKVIRNDENVWWAKAANQGARAADKDSKYLIFMHHDVIILNHAWIDLLINVSQSKNAGIVGTSLKKYEMDGQYLQFCHESCLLVTRECWNECGPFAEDLPQVGAPFILNMKASAKGYAPQAITNPMVHHYGIFAMDGNVYEEMGEEAQSVMGKHIMKMQESVS